MYSHLSTSLEIAQYTAAQVQQGIHVLFSAHGVPESYILAGGPNKVRLCGVSCALLHVVALYDADT